MKRNRQMAPKVLLDANVWRYLADAGAGNDLHHASLRCGAKILIAPSVVYEALRTEDVALRQKLIELMTRKRWVRLLPEAYCECAEVLSEIRRLRPQWLHANPDIQPLTRLKRDWTRAHGGFWDRARFDTSGEAARLIALNDGGILARARSEAQENRMTMTDSGLSFDSIDLKRVAGKPLGPIVGWDGDHIEPWRIAAHHTFSIALSLPQGAYVDWLSPLIDLGKLHGSSWVRFWFYEAATANMPTCWMRWAFEVLLSLRKVSDGTPCDTQLSTYLIECDHFVSADRVFVSTIRKSRDSAPVRIALPWLVPGGSDGVSALFSIIEQVIRPVTNSG
jgi:hypothetical protein